MKNLFKKSIVGITLSSMVIMGMPIQASAGTFETLGIGAAAVFGATQLNHNNHQKKINQNLYNSGRMGTFWYNGKKVNCHIEHGSKACYQQDGNHWTYINNG